MLLARVDDELAIASEDPESQVLGARGRVHHTVSVKFRPFRPL